MRDHPYHTMPVMARMWGARWDQNLRAARKLTAYRDQCLYRHDRDLMFRAATGKTENGELRVSFSSVCPYVFITYLFTYLFAYIL